MGYDQWGYRNLVIDSLAGEEQSLYDLSGLLLRAYDWYAAQALGQPNTFDEEKGSGYFFY